MEDLTIEQSKDNKEDENSENNDKSEEQKEEVKENEKPNENIIIEEKKEKEEENKIEEENKVEEEEKEEIIDPIELEKRKIRLLLKAANEDMNEKNYKDAEDKYSTIIETENKDILEDIKEKMIEILLNYSLSLYYQMKYESSTKILYDIIINYDSKNKEAYLLLLKILFDINEYNRAKLLIAKINAIFGYDGNELNEFNEINNEIDKIIKRNKNNIQRQFYYNAEKEIFNFRNNLNFFYWCFYSLAALIIGHYLSKLL